MTEDHTPLVGVKWSMSTLVKALEQNYTNVFQQLIKSDLQPDIKNEKINQCLKVFLSIYIPVLEFGVKVKR